MPSRTLPTLESEMANASVKQKCGLPASKMTASGQLTLGCIDVVLPIGAARKIVFVVLLPMPGCLVSPTNMRFTQNLACTTSPSISLKLWPETPSHLRRQDFRPSCNRLVVTWPLPRRRSTPRSASAAVTQMEAAIGWLQRHSGLSGEGRVSEPEVDSCSVTAAQWLSVVYRAIGALPAGLGARWVPAGTGPSRRPNACGGSP